MESGQIQERFTRPPIGHNTVLGVKRSEGEGRLRNKTSTSAVTGWCLIVQQNNQPE